MLSAGILGGILGLQGGCCWWLAQKVSGETVEQRWKNEYLQITRLQEIKVNIEYKEIPKRKIYVFPLLNITSYFVFGIKLLYINLFIVEGFKTGIDNSYF
jgi:hypothetical protein